MLLLIFISLLGIGLYAKNILLSILGLIAIIEFFIIINYKKKMSKLTLIKEKIIDNLENLKLLELRLKVEQNSDKRTINVNKVSEDDLEIMIMNIHKQYNKCYKDLSKLDVSYKNYGVLVKLFKYNNQLNNYLNIYKKCKTIINFTEKKIS